jgi:hypothetical protein
MAKFTTLGLSSRVAGGGGIPKPPHISPRQVKFLTAVAAIGIHGGRTAGKFIKWMATTRKGKMTAAALGGGVAGGYGIHRVHRGFRRIVAGYQDPRSAHER